MIPYGHQDVSRTDIDAVVAVLRSDFLTQGPAVTRFEQAVATRVNAKYAIASRNCAASELPSFSRTPRTGDDIPRSRQLH